MKKNRMVAGGRCESMFSTSCLFAAAFAVLGCLITPPAYGQEAQTNKVPVCDQITQAAAKACDFNAQRDFWLTVGSCDNLANAGEKATCSDKAQLNLQSARAGCQAQTVARQQLCQALGQAPYDPKIHPRNFVKNITNPFFPLKPGTSYVYDVNIPDNPAGRDTMLITRETVDILGVTCLVVHDTLEIDGQVTQETFDYFAQDKRGNVWYFGSDTVQLEDDVVVGVEGSWQAGIDGAQPGIIMKAEPKVGDEYRQNFALGNVEDAAKVVAVEQDVSVPFGSFSNAVKILESSALEPDARENTYYVPNVGGVLKVDLVTGERYELISIERK